MTSGENLILGHPRGAFVLAGTELWERFGFFGLLGLLVHFLTASTMDAGFGWESENALSLVGTFFAAIWILPIVGSWLADRFIGTSRSIALGALLMMAGYFLFALPTSVMHIVESITGVPVVSAITGSGVPLGNLWPDTQAVSTLTASTGADDAAGTILAAYRRTSLVFYAGLCLIVLGNMLFKPCVVAAMGLFYEPGDKRREGGYTILYLCINLGGLLANLIVGSVGERFGWHWGFACTGLGMLVGLVLFLANRHGSLGRLDLAGGNRDKALRVPLTGTDRLRLRAVALIMVFTACYIATYGQLVGLVNNFVFQDIDRNLGGFEVPATWFLSLNPLFIMLFGAFFAALWQRLGESGRNPPVLVKYFLGMTLICLSFICLAGAAVDGGNAADGKGHMLWIVVAYLLFTLGELLIFPIFMALITRLVPRQHSNLGAGLFFFAAGIGSYFSGQIGAMTAHYSEITVFLAIGIGALAAGVVALLVSSMFSRWIDS